MEHHHYLKKRKGLPGDGHNVRRREKLCTRPTALSGPKFSNFAQFILGSIKYLTSMCFCSKSTPFSSHVEAEKGVFAGITRYFAELWSQKNSWRGIIFLSSYCEIRGREPPIISSVTLRDGIHQFRVASLSSNFRSTAFRVLENKCHKGGSRAEHFLLCKSWHPRPVVAERGR